MGREKRRERERERMTGMGVKGGVERDPPPPPMGYKGFYMDRESFNDVCLTKRKKASIFCH